MERFSSGTIPVPFFINLQTPPDRLTGYGLTAPSCDTHSSGAFGAGRRQVATGRGACLTSTQRLSTPRRTIPSRYLGSTARRTDGKRSSRPWNAIRASSTASDAPRAVGECRARMKDGSSPCARCPTRRGSRTLPDPDSPRRAGRSPSVPREDACRPSPDPRAQRARRAGRGCRSAAARRRPVPEDRGRRGDAVSNVSAYGTG